MIYTIRPPASFSRPHMQKQRISCKAVIKATQSDRLPSCQKWQKRVMEAFSLPPLLAWGSHGILQSWNVERGGGDVRTSKNSAVAKV